MTDRPWRSHFDRHLGIVENATGDLVFTGYECESLATMHQIDKNSRLEYEQATLFCILYYQEKQENSRYEALRKAQFKLRNLTGDELSDKYKQQLEDYFEQQKGEQKAEIVKNVRLRLYLLCGETLPFVSPYNWAGFVSQGLA